MSSFARTLVALVAVPLLGVFVTSESRLLVTYRGHGAFRTPTAVSVVVDTGMRARTFTDGDFLSERDSAYRLPELAVPDSGNLSVSVSIRSSAGETVAATAVTLTLGRRYRHNVAVVVGSRRPPEGLCWHVVRAVALRGPASGVEAESLFVRVSSIPADAVC
ncbi:MAG TPA: hypothetical protein VFU02_22960 [Polyangiaceae bacterium]|jgi:hypothetical protein|nr:hypothetical protein [Polyangiaceae bacterium]